MIRSRSAAIVSLLCTSLGAGCIDEIIGVDPDPPPTTTPATPVDLAAEGLGAVPERFTAELWVHGNTAYTSTWSTRTVAGVSARGNAIKIWDVSAATPVLVDSLIVSDATTIGDVQVTADGRYLIAATEAAPGSIAIYDLGGNPRRPVLLSRFTNADTDPGVHTAEVQTVNGRLYAFLSIDPRADTRARLVIVDITDPSKPVMVFSRTMGNPFMHDVFVRDGILMTAVWNDGIVLYDIGGGGRGGTVVDPVQLGSVQTVAGKVHNIYWFHDPVTGSKRYAFIGEEGPASIPTSARGDLHVVDVSDMSNPREVAFYTVAGAGVHNLTVDEQRGILYGAWYNGGVHALNVRGDLGNCDAAYKAPDGRCDLAKMSRVLGKGPAGVTVPVFIWGVHFAGGRLYASDMLNGLWRISTVPAS